ncbi:putative tetratricopeptide-like helical domain superfamily [Helianthus annuus]|uniref:Putative pentatricopeptide repeat protein n=1 Tax=Helianthus annuus TaxID=4232 RepID=A0A251TIA5_HELAN|nr:pentatricopeptide repeat-containing protein At2g06000 [Helianthus annuus]XP_021988253.1 pentatricopeptide repeat-containing protein At2g06000 [Helianthus annuus]KAF5803730.1 putative tetratricopeptide-like helical domain superfamily [Helianthus annuus]KAJ0568370.1 putative tetratricopeptide-like helical domain superfamily [Helianthus annuus]KAJ0574705.1 putative tetratricopeptide-like helical domain superfamily [Helianthus annuus]KAJ0739036.1 putative tetratricopeptide-like helical domain s
MPLRLPINLPTYSFRLSNLQFVSKISSVSKSQGQIEVPGSLWFVKVVCTLCVRRKSSLKKVIVSDYLRNNLNPLIACSVIEHMISSLHNPELAFGFLEYSKNMLNLVHSVETYSFVLRVFCQVGIHDLARQVIGLMRVDGLVPDSAVLGIVVMSFVDAGKFEVAKELVLEHSGVISLFVTNKLLSSWVRNNQVDEAVALFENIVLRPRSYSPDACAFNIVISGLCRAGEVDKAFKLFNQMRNFGCLPDSVTYNTLMNGFCRAGNVTKAHELLNEVCMVDECSPNVVTFTSVISGYCKLSKMEEALVLFDDMIDRGIRPNTITFNVIIDGFGKIGNVSSVSTMYKKMLTFGCTPDVITFTSIINGHCRVGELHKALNVWDEMNRRNLYPNLYTFSILIHTLCKESRLNEARALLKQLKRRTDIVPEAFIYNPVIDGFCKAGNVDEANMIVKEMEEKRCKLDKLTFTILIIGHCMKGRMVEAIRLFDKMVLVGCVPDSVTVNSLVSRLLKAGMPKEAYQIRKAVLGVRVPQTDVLCSKKIDIPVAV